MDAKNLFDTKSTFTLIRIEYLMFMLIILYALVRNYNEVHWGNFIFFFVIIDVIGYLPGALAFRFSRTRNISFVFYILYNLMHSFITILLLSLVWCIWIGPEWALLAMPLHLCGDRAIFGNFMKPFSTFFEPSLHPAFAKFRNEFSQINEPEKGINDAAK